MNGIGTIFGSVLKAVVNVLTAVKTDAVIMLIVRAFLLHFRQLSARAFRFVWLEWVANRALIAPAVAPVAVLFGLALDGVAARPVADMVAWVCHLR